MGGLLFSRYGSSLQLLVYGRIAEFVCTLINIPLKCCDVWMAWLLGNPSTHEASWVEGSLLFIVLLLLVGIDPCLPAQGQCALPPINPRGLKDLKREGKELRRVHELIMYTNQFLHCLLFFSLLALSIASNEGEVTVPVPLGGRRKQRGAGWEVLGVHS